MANIIAVVWDFDKTLVNGYMEEPIFNIMEWILLILERRTAAGKYRVEQFE